MRYFLYISDAKVRMLCAQLGTHGSVASKSIVRGGIGTWFGIERHVERRVSDDTLLIHDLNRISEWIAGTERVGNIDDAQAPWIEDTFPCYLSAPLKSDTGAPVVLFHNQDHPTHPRIHVLLVGSAQHI